MWEYIKSLFFSSKRSAAASKASDEEKEAISTEDTNMKYLIVGLGNIGAEYDNTRHNIGFDVVDGLAAKHDATWKTDTLGAIAKIKHKGRQITLLKPSTYMNRSGKAVNYWLQKSKIDRTNLLVVVDDLHLDFAKLRLRGKGSDGGHNGLKDIQQVLGGNKYPRLKVGVGKDFRPGEQVRYVLGQWTEEQQADIPKLVAKAGETCLAFTSIGLKFAMERYNR